MRAGFVLPVPAVLVPAAAAASVALAPEAALALLLGAAVLPPAAVPGWFAWALVLPEEVFVLDEGLPPAGLLLPVALDVSVLPPGAADCAAGSEVLPEPPHAVCSAHAATSRCQREGFVMARSPS
ncbi:MAG TPA: hypothetical protein VFN67_26610 [Polyangiales bacterium]|nr:hypothetical protein [Polyangiales bacterium]